MAGFRNLLRVLRVLRERIFPCVFEAGSLFAGIRFPEVSFPIPEKSEEVEECAREAFEVGVF